MPLTLALLALFISLRFPAAPLLAGIAAGLIMVLRDSPLKAPPRLFTLSQGVLGCVISSSFTAAVAANLIEVWPLALFSIFSGLLAAALIGWIVTKKGKLPGSTAFWGITPGGGTTMPLMAAAYGGNLSLVAFMQYVRILLIAGLAALVASLLDLQSHETTGFGGALASMFGPVDWPLFAVSLGFAAACSFLGRLSRIPAGSLLFPAIIGAVLNSLGILQTAFPPWFLALAYAAIGWFIGLGFSRELLRLALHSLPVILASMFSLIAFCALVGGLLVLFAGIDPLTAFLATCPGGVDSAAILASSTSADAGFVMSIQASRLFVVVLFGPVLARYFSKKSERRQ